MKQTITLKADNKTVATLKMMISLKKQYREVIASKIKTEKV